MSDLLNSVWHPPILDAMAVFANKTFRDTYMRLHVAFRLAVQVRAIRDSMGMTRKQFAARVGKDPMTIFRIESCLLNTGVGIQTLLDIAKGLDMALLVQFASWPEFLYHETPNVPAPFEAADFSVTP